MPSDFQACNNPLGFTVKLLQAITKLNCALKWNLAADFQYNLTPGAKDLKPIPIT